jgi:hypothetical protein
MAAVIQAFFAIAIWMVTRRYVRLTRDLVTESKNQIRIHLYDRRLKVLQAALAVLVDFGRARSFAQSPKIWSREIRETLRRETLEVRFLFEDRKILEFFEKVDSNIAEYAEKKPVCRLDSAKPSEDDLQRERDVKDLAAWLTKHASNEVTQLFDPYLKLSE